MKQFALKSVTIFLVAGTMSATTYAQGIGGTDPKIAYSTTSTWTITTPSNVNLNRTNAQQEVEVGISVHDYDTFLYSMSVAPYLYTQQDGNVHMSIDNVWASYNGNNPPTYEYGWQNGSGAVSVGYITFCIPVNYGGGSFYVTYDVVDNVDDPVKESTSSRSTTITFVYP